MPTEIVVAYKDRETLERTFLQSPGLERARLVLIENGQYPIALPALFNTHKRTSRADWLIFCHEDFVVFEPQWLDRLPALDPRACYGPIGVDRQGRFLGQIRQTDETLYGQPADMAEVMGLDEMCLIVPRQIYSTVNFDERFPFDFYVHDYCLQARQRGYVARILQLNCQHRSKTITRDVQSPRYLAAKQLFIEKYSYLRPLATTTFNLRPKYWNTVEAIETLTSELRLVPAGSKVLEVGPAAGHMTEALLAKGCRVTAIEVDAELAAFAKPFCERLILGDVEQLDLEEVLRDERFDVILLGDVLEHLKEPAGVLYRLRSCLAPAGFLVVSVPNVAHASVRLTLLEGNFNYQAQGLLDRTHLRFFTLKTIEALFQEAGYEFRDLQRIRKGFFETEIPNDPSVVPLGVLRGLCCDPEAATYQFVFRAVKGWEPGPSEAPGGRVSTLPPEWTPSAVRRQIALAYLRWGQYAFWKNDMPRARKLFYRALALRPGLKMLLYIMASPLPFRGLRLIARVVKALRSARARHLFLRGTVRLTSAAQV